MSLFSGEMVKLTPPRVGDAAIMTEWYTDSEYLQNIDSDIAKQQSEAEIQKQLNDGDDGFYFQIRLIADDRLIGFVTLFNFEWNNQTARLAIGIGDSENRSKGYGSEAIALIMNYGFNELNLYKINLDVISYNRRALKAYQRAGFQIEGINKRAIMRNQVRSDIIYMGIFQEDWLSQHQTNAHLAE